MLSLFILLFVALQNLDATEAVKTFASLYRVSTPEIQSTVLSPLIKSEAAVLGNYATALAQAQLGVDMRPVDEDGVQAQQTAAARTIVDLQPEVLTFFALHADAVWDLYGNYSDAIAAALQPATGNWYDPPLSAPPDYMLEPGFFTDLLGVKTATSNPFETALSKVLPGSIIHVMPGQYPKFKVDTKRFLETHAETWFIAQGYVEIQPHTVGGSPTTNWKNGANSLAFYGITWLGSTKAVFIFDTHPDQPSAAYADLVFVNCVLDGGWNHDTNSGSFSSQLWGIRGYDFRRFTMVNCEIKNIKGEHAIYYSYPMGGPIAGAESHDGDYSMQLVGCYFHDLGRTAVQIVGRDGEVKGKKGPFHGDVIIEDCVFEDACRGDGGSYVTFAGNQDGLHILDNVVVRGNTTGALVSHIGDGSANRPNGPIHLIDCVFDFSAGGDRLVCDVQANTTPELRIVNTSMTASGGRDALSVGGGVILTIDGASVPTPAVRKELKATP